MGNVNKEGNIENEESGRKDVDERMLPCEDAANLTRNKKQRFVFSTAHGNALRNGMLDGQLR